ALPGARRKRPASRSDHDAIRRRTRRQRLDRRGGCARPAERWNDPGLARLPGTPRADLAAFGRLLHSRHRHRLHATRSRAGSAQRPRNRPLPGSGARSRQSVVASRSFIQRRSLVRIARAASVAVGFAALFAAIAPREAGGASLAWDGAGSASDTLGVTGETLSGGSWTEQLYRLGISRFAHRDYAGALHALEAIRYDSAFADADRAAFLLATLYLRLGHREGLAQLSARVQALPPSGFTRWIHAQTAMSAVRGGIDLPAGARSGSEADLLAAAWLLSEGEVVNARALLAQIDCGSSGCKTLALHLRGMADELSGHPDSGAWNELAEMEPKSELDRIWIEGAQLRLARRALERGQDPRVHFSEPTTAGANQSDARRGLGALEPWREHIRGLYAWERGDTASARRVLEGIVRNWPGYPKARAVEIALASLDLEAGDPAGARERVLRADQSRQEDTLLLDTLHSERALDELWKAWERGAGYGDPVRLDLASVRE